MFFFFRLSVASIDPNADMDKACMECMYGNQRSQMAFEEAKHYFVQTVTDYRTHFGSLKLQNFQGISERYAELRQRSAKKEHQELFGVMRTFDNQWGTTSAACCYHYMKNGLRRLFEEAVQSESTIQNYRTQTLANIDVESKEWQVLIDRASIRWSSYATDFINAAGDPVRVISNEQDAKTTLALYHGLLKRSRDDINVPATTYGALAVAWESMLNEQEEVRKQVDTTTTVDAFIDQTHPAVVVHTIDLPGGHTVLAYSCEGDEKYRICGDSAPYIVINPPIDVWKAQEPQYLQSVSTAFETQDEAKFITNMAQMIYSVACLMPFRRGSAAFSEWMLAAGLKTFNERTDQSLHVSVPLCSIAYFDQLALSARSFEDFKLQFAMCFLEKAPLYDGISIDCLEVSPPMFGNCETRICLNDCVGEENSARQQ